MQNARPIMKYYSNAHKKSSFTLYLMVEKPGMRLSDRLRRAMQARSTSVISSTISEPALEVPLFDPEKTEPRQPVVFPTPQMP